ncbi:hypothetical protein AMTR_s00167p00028180 [Amborella trichopoda]|uniref:Uncharacterized protein n=1 Tax=Amborella trichopoda TaxID=13333 RepID=W1PLJ0_AMBTC|nr:hypothetical protein AMTR_s00167p00028180 [Amborella trichopoda]
MTPRVRSFLESRVFSQKYTTESFLFCRHLLVKIMEGTYYFDMPLEWAADNILILFLRKCPQPPRPVWGSLLSRTYYVCDNCYRPNRSVAVRLPSWASKRMQDGSGTIMDLLGM